MARQTMAWTFGRTAAPGRRGRRYWFAVLWFGLIFRSSTAPFASPQKRARSLRMIVTLRSPV